MLINHLICVVLLTFIVDTGEVFCWDSSKECKEYTKLVYVRVHAMPLLAKAFPFTVEHKRCIRANALIVGGANARQGEFPHMAAVGYSQGSNTEWLCGGSLISQNYVLTAAHCAHTKWGTPRMVCVGSLYTDCSEYSNNISVEKTITHPDYSPPKVYNDVSLLKLVANVTFTRYLRPACLSVVRNLTSLPTNVLTATGWGHTQFGGPSSTKLLKVSLEIMNNDECKTHFPYEQHFPNGIDDSLFCARGHYDRLHDTCQGDSGGPIQTTLNGNECLYQIVGITSIGKQCGSGSPAIYMNVASFIPWIESTISKDPF